MVGSWGLNDSGVPSHFQEAMSGIEGVWLLLGAGFVLKCSGKPGVRQGTGRARNREHLFFVTGFRAPSIESTSILAPLFRGAGLRTL